MWLSQTISPQTMNSIVETIPVDRPYILRDLERKKASTSAGKVGPTAIWDRLQLFGEVINQILHFFVIRQ